jgi:hypothetical protein
MELSKPDPKKVEAIQNMLQPTGASVAKWLAHLPFTSKQGRI